MQSRLPASKPSRNLYGVYSRWLVEPYCSSMSTASSAARSVLATTFDPSGNLDVALGLDPSKKGDSERYHSARHTRIQNMTYIPKIKIKARVQVYVPKKVRSDKFKTGSEESLDEETLKGGDEKLPWGGNPSESSWICARRKTSKNGECDFDHGEKTFIAEGTIIFEEATDYKGPRRGKRTKEAKEARNYETTQRRHQCKRGAFKGKTTNTFNEKQNDTTVAPYPRGASLPHATSHSPMACHPCLKVHPPHTRPFASKNHVTQVVPPPSKSVFHQDRYLQPGITPWSRLNPYQGGHFVNRSTSESTSSPQHDHPCQPESASPPAN
ncbi:DNA-directed RNA polymerases IV and V subunit 2, partial [Mucuna pruriens]